MALALMARFSRISLMIVAFVFTYGPDAFSTDRTRAYEPLEAFKLSELRYVGRRSSPEGMVAVVVDPDGKSYEVRVGNYLGNNYGHVVVIRDSEVMVVELHENGIGGWEERTNFLPRSIWK